MIYNNLAVVPLSAGYINPSLRDALVYSNCVWPYSLEGFIGKLREAEGQIQRDERMIAATYPRVSQVLDLPVYRCDSRTVGVVDQLFTTADSEYKVFGSSLPKVRLRVYSGIVCAHMTTSEWEEHYRTLLNKFPDLMRIWDYEIHAVSLNVLKIIDATEVYYRRAAFFATNRKIEEEQPFNSIVQLKAMGMQYQAIKERFKSHLSETAPFLDSLDGIHVSSERTSVFDTLSEEG